MNRAADLHSHKNPYLFVVGSPRSGTTLLKRLLNAHPAIAMTRETHWVPKLYKRRVGLTDTGIVTPAILPKLFKHPRFSHLKLDPSDLEQLLEKNSTLTYAQFVSHLYNLFGQRKKKRLVGDKTPPYVRKIDTLHQLWPHARFIHLIRDGREVYLSMRNWRKVNSAVGTRAPWNEDQLSTIALWWEWQVRLGREAGHRLPPGLYYELTYSELIQNTDKQCQMLCEFLDLPYEKSMLSFYEGKIQKEPGLSTNSSWLPPTKGLRDWRTEMTEYEVEKFEAVAGNLLDELGMERALPNCSLPAKKHAAKMRRLFDGKPLPQSW